jgi:hypothetical protein
MAVDHLALPLADKGVHGAVIRDYPYSSHVPYVTHFVFSLPLFIQNYRTARGARREFHQCPDSSAIRSQHARHACSLEPCNCLFVMRPRWWWRPRRGPLCTT